MMLASQQQNTHQKTLGETEEEKTVLVIPVKEQLRGEALRVSHMLRNAGTSVELEVMGRKMTKALEDADRRNISYAVIIGERELEEKKVVVRNLRKRVQSTVKIEDVSEALKS